MTRNTVAYARVSSQDEKDDPERKKLVLEPSLPGTAERLSRRSGGSGLTYPKNEVKRLRNDIRVDRIGPQTLMLGPTLHSKDTL